MQAAINYPWAKELEKTVINSLTTTFGLDFLLFKDKVGGDVDTIQNARKNIYATDASSTTAVDFIQGDCIRDAGSGTAAPVVDVAYAKQSSAGCGLRCAMRPTAAWTTGA